MGEILRIIRVACVVLLIASTGVVTHGWVNAQESGIGDRSSEGDVVAPERNGTVVFGTQAMGRTPVAVKNMGDSPGEIVAVDETGTILYYNNTYQTYWDIDPVPTTSHTVMYVASEFVPQSECGSTSCYRNVVEQVNLSTGGVTRIYSHVVRNEKSIRWHDVDRINDTHLLVGDIANDRVFIVNTTAGITVWSWELATNLDTLSGGEYPTDWAHLNDVELIDERTVMVSLRNHDQVVFIDRQTGLDRSKTLGVEGNFSILEKQHNPDYIPSERGGPALLVADSHNNRIVEYQRRDGEWQRSWEWTSEYVDWPRDGDRLPNGNTLVTDSNGNRVLEVNPEGEIVWQLKVKRPYEAEVLGTGDESAGGRSATSIGLNSATISEGELSFVQKTLSLLPTELVSAILFVLPRWVGLKEVVAIAVGGLVLTTWMYVEFKAWGLKVQVTRPSIRFER